ncbi:MAG: MraY family glycosyltransferase [Candidatus Zixiibacteriota bacterium]
MITIGYKYSILDQPGLHKRHKKPTPILGGVALFLVFWLTVSICFLFFSNIFEELFGSILFIFLGGLIIFLVGVSDDLSPLSAKIKLTAQIAAGLVLYFGGLKIELISTPYGSIDTGIFSIAITVLWVVVLTNAINLIDGLDGLASGVSLIGAVTLFVIGLLYDVGPVLIFIIVMIGFLSLFLNYNHYPARIFLGDSGSMQIGYYFAVFSLMFPLKSYTATALYVPLLAMGVPLLEVSSSFLRRLVSGKNILRADRRHLFHYLSFLGFSPRQVVIIFEILAIIYGLFALAMFYWDRLIVFGFLIFFMVVIFVIFFILITKYAPRIKANGN